MSLWQKYHKSLLIGIFILPLFQLVALNIVNYNARKGIVSNAVRKIYIDHTHRIWLGSDNGVSCITSNGITNYVYSKGLDYSKIWEITQCPDNSLWFGSFGNGLYEFKNNRFYHYPLPGTRANNSIRKLKAFGGYLFIGTEAGLNVFDYKKHAFISFKNLSEHKNFQILDFFEYNQKLYFQSFFYGTYEVNTSNFSYKIIRYNQFQNKWNYSAYQYNNTLFLARTHFNIAEKHNLLYWKTDKYLAGGVPDSIAISTIIWEFANTANNEMYAACYGVRDDSGGLYKWVGNAMERMNERFGINSNQLWDIAYDKKFNKLYIASIDKGLFVCDFNNIVEKMSIEKQTDILDIKKWNNKLFI